MLSFRYPPNRKSCKLSPLLSIMCFVLEILPDFLAKFHFYHFLLVACYCKTIKKDPYPVNEIISIFSH